MPSADTVPPTARRRLAQTLPIAQHGTAEVDEIDENRPDIGSILGDLFDNAGSDRDGDGTNRFGKECQRILRRRLVIDPAGADVSTR